MIIKFLNKFTQKISLASKSSIQDLNEAKYLFLKLTKARIKFEGKLFNILYPLSKGKQVHVLEQVLTGFKAESSPFYIRVPEWIYYNKDNSSSTENFIKLRSENNAITTHNGRNLDDLIEACKLNDKMIAEIYRDYEYLFWLMEVQLGDNADDTGIGLTEREQNRLLKKIISEVYYLTYLNTFDYYSSITKDKDEESRIPFILDKTLRKAKIKESIDKAQELENSIDSNSIAIEIPDEIVSISNSQPMLQWLNKGGVGDLVELLYRLERNGFINLGEFKAKGGNMSELCRRLCYVFDFKGDNPIGSLKTNLGKLKDFHLGPGIIDKGALAAIDRKRGGRMSDSIPDQ